MEKEYQKIGNIFKFDEKYYLLFLIPRYNNIEDKKRGTYYDKTRSIQRN